MKLEDEVDVMLAGMTAIPLPEDTRGWDYTISYTTRLSLSPPGRSPETFHHKYARPSKYANGFNL